MTTDNHTAPPPEAAPAKMLSEAELKEISRRDYVWTHDQTAMCVDRRKLLAHVAHQEAKIANLQQDLAATSADLKRSAAWSLKVFDELARWGAEEWGMSLPPTSGHSLDKITAIAAKARKQKEALSAARQELAAKAGELEGANQAIAKAFGALAEQWKRERPSYSSFGAKLCGTDSYKAIIAMGPSVVPHIIQRLRKQPDHWFIALSEITGASPIKTENRGIFSAMVSDWIEWYETSANAKTRAAISPHPQSAPAEQAICKTPELLFTAGPLRDACQAGWHAARGEAAAANACKEAALSERCEPRDNKSDDQPSPSVAAAAKGEGPAFECPECGCNKPWNGGLSGQLHCGYLGCDWTGTWPEVEAAKARRAEGDKLDMVHRPKCSEDARGVTIEHSPPACGPAKEQAGRHLQHEGQSGERQFTCPECRGKDAFLLLRGLACAFSQCNWRGTWADVDRAAKSPQQPTRERA